MHTRLIRILSLAAVVLVIIGATLGVLFAFDFLTLEEIKRYAMQSGIAVGVVAVAALVISVILPAA
jgi:hypothetical protein